MRELGMATAFTMMWQSLLDSSVWLGTSKETRLVWVTMLLMKDADGVVRSGVPGIAHRAVVSVEECRKAIKQLSEPDPDTMTQANQGRRIKKVEAGWLILNHEKYRTSEDIRAKWRRQKKNQRAKNSGLPLGGESTFEKRMGDGAPEEELDKLTDNR